MTDQNDRQGQSLTGQVRDPLTGRYFQPCHSRLVVHCHDWEPDKEYVTHGLLLIWKLSMGGWKTAFLPSNTKWRRNCNCLCSIKNAYFKEFWILISQYNNILSPPWKRYMYATLQVKAFAWSPFDNQLFWFREAFFINQVASYKMLGAMATKMVPTLRWPIRDSATNLN